jgi:flagellar biosynthesis protein FlhB
MASARVHPPSEQQLSAARAAGLKPESPVLSSAGACAGLLVLGALGEHGAARIVHVARALLEGACSAPLSAEGARQLVAEALPAMLALPMSAGLGTALVLRFVAGQRGGRGRLRTPRARPVLWAPRLVAIVALASLALPRARALVLGAEPPLYALGRALVGLTVALLVAGLFEAMLARAAFVRALMLSRHEHDALDRELHGHPAVRAARHQALR